MEQAALKTQNTSLIAALKDREAHQKRMEEEIRRLRDNTKELASLKENDVLTFLSAQTSTPRTTVPPPILLGSSVSNLDVELAKAKGSLIESQQLRESMRVRAESFEYPPRMALIASEPKAGRESLFNLNLNLPPSTSSASYSKLHHPYGIPPSHSIGPALPTAFSLTSPCTAYLEIISASALQPPPKRNAPVKAPNSYCTVNFCTSHQLFRSKTVYCCSDPVFSAEFVTPMLERWETVEIRVWDRDGYRPNPTLLGENRIVICDGLRRQGERDVPLYAEGQEVGRVKLRWHVVSRDCASARADVVLDTIERLSARMQRLEHVFSRVERGQEPLLQEL